MFALNIVPAYMGLILTAFVYIPFGSLLIPYLASIVHSLVKKDKVPGVAGKHLDDKSFDWSSYEINGNRLHAQILAYTVTNQIINAFTEIGLPIIMRFVGGKVAEMKGGGAEGKRGDGSAAKGEKPMPDADDEKAFLQRIREEASLPEYTLFVDYAEMVVQVRASSLPGVVRLLTAPAQSRRRTVWLRRRVDRGLAYRAAVRLHQQLL